MEKLPDGTSVSAIAKPRRRWLAFSLRTLLLLLTVFGLSLGWWVNSALRQRRAVAAIRAADGKVVYDYQRHPELRGKFGPIKLPSAIVEALGDDFLHTVVTIWAVQHPTDEMMESVAELKHLDGFLIQNWNPCEVTDAGMAKLANLQSLRGVNINSNRLTDESLRVIGTFRKLENLELTGPGRRPGITDDGLRHLQNLFELRSLFLANTSVSDAGLPNLSRMTQLWTLNLFGTNVSGSGFAGLTHLPKLEHLTICNAPVDDASLEHIASLPNLRSLGLARTKVTDKGLVHLLKLKKLETLDLSETEISDAAWEVFAQLPNLEQLTLEKTRITGKGMERLRECLKLRYLDLSETEVGDEAISTFLPPAIFSGGILTLHLRRTRVTPAKVQELRSRQVDIHGNPMRVEY